MTTPIRAEAFYEALFDDEAFDQLPSLLAEAGGGQSATLGWQPSHGGYQTLSNHGLPAALVDDYIANFYDLDFWRLAYIRNKSQTGIYNINILVSDRAFIESEMYNDCILKHGADIYYCIGGVIDTPSGSGLLRIHRGARQPNFDEANIAALENAVKHLRRVLQVRSETFSGASEAAIARASLETIGHAAIVVLANGRVVQTNAASEAVLQRADGLTCKSGRLAAAARSSDQALAAAVARATAKSHVEAGAVIVDRGPDLAPYLISVTPLVGRFGLQAAILVFRDPDASDHTLALRLREFFGLTPAEAAIATDIGLGMSVPQITAKRRVSITTLRAQLKTLAAKMRVSRQSEVAAIVAALPPLSNHTGQERS